VHRRQIMLQTEVLGEKEGERLQGNAASGGDDDQTPVIFTPYFQMEILFALLPRVGIPTSEFQDAPSRALPVSLGLLPLGLSGAAVPFDDVPEGTLPPRGVALLPGGLTLSLSFLENLQGDTISDTFPTASPVISYSRSCLCKECQVVVETGVAMDLSCSSPQGLSHQPSPQHRCKVLDHPDGGQGANCQRKYHQQGIRARRPWPPRSTLLHWERISFFKTSFPKKLLHGLPPWRMKGGSSIIPSTLQPDHEGRRGHGPTE
jgi:hypothetical protein